MLFVEAAVAASLKRRGLDVSFYARVLSAGWHTLAGLENLFPARALVLADDDEARVLHVLQSVAQLNADVSLLLAVRRAGSHDLAKLACAGLHDCFDMSNESEQHRLFDTLRVLARSSQQLPPGVVADISGELERRVVEFCLRNGRRHLTTEDVAAWFGQHRRTLESWVGKRTARSISFWLNEGRARYAYARHEDGLSYTRIAHEMGYASSSSVGMLLVRWRRRGDGSSHA